MWQLFNLAKACFCRPSDLLNIQNDYVAFCLDEAVISMGTSLENHIDEVMQGTKDPKAARAKAQYALEDFLNEGKAKESIQFATPTPTKKRKE